MPIEPDMDYYRRTIAPCLPPAVLDFHAHIWTAPARPTPSSPVATEAERYMVTESHCPAERLLANERRLVVLLHVPGQGRLADPRVQAGVRWLAGECPDARIVLAHCGRCYLPGEMRAAVPSLRGLDNIWMDTSMVMDPLVLQIAMEAVGPRRLLFGTDFPVAAMHGRRVRVMDHWVDVVLPGYPDSAYRVAGDGFRAGPMAWEIVLAIDWAARMVGIDDADRNAIFGGNGMELLRSDT